MIIKIQYDKLLKYEKLKTDKKIFELNINSAV